MDLPRSRRLPSPSPFLLACLVLAFVSCELVHGVARASPEAAPGTHGPSIGAVLAAAYRAAGLDRDPSRGWVRRARLAGLVPSLTVRTGRDASWQSDDVTVDHDLAIDIRATWRLDRLAFDGRELQVASIEASRRRERRDLARRVIRVYFVWQRASRGEPGSISADARLLDETEEPDGTGLHDAEIRSITRATTRSRALEAAAELDALTDGWFSETLATPRDASGSRTRLGAGGRR